MLEPLPAVCKPDRPASPYVRNLPPRAAFGWLRDGWRDLADPPVRHHR